MQMLVFHDELGEPVGIPRELIERIHRGPCGHPTVRVITNDQYGVDSVRIRETLEDAIAIYNGEELGR